MLENGFFQLSLKIAAGRALLGRLSSGFVTTLCLALAALPASAASPSATPIKSADEWLAEAYRLEAEHHFEDALAAFQHARESGADAPTMALECGYLLATHDDADGVRRYFLEALQSN